MRLIDADALIKDFEIWYKEVGHETPRDRLIQNIITYAMDAVNDAEAFDAEPVRHGEWVQASDDDQDEWMYVCSECREETFFPFDEKDNYCPNCGAKMDGGKSDEHAKED